MNGEAVDKIAALALATGEVRKIDGDSYSVVKQHRIAPHFAAPVPLITHTLNGFAQLIETETPAVGMLIHIKDHMHVDFISSLDDSPEKDRRACLYSAEAPDITGFQFGHFMSTEQFIINVQSLFQDSQDRGVLLHYVSHIVATEAITLADDGISQQAVVKKGTSGALMENQPAPERVTLAPFRTFPELNQPESAFIFRVKKTGGEIQCALFEADGGRWRVEAILIIEDWLLDRLENTAPIIA